jgi:adenylate kinase family enzyme
MDTNKLVEEVEGLLKGFDKIELDQNDVKISGILGQLHKARVRMELSHKFIAVDFPQGTNQNIVIRRIINNVSGQKKKTADESSDNKVSSSIVMPKIKRHQHTYIVPKIAKDMISVLTDDA